MSLTSGAIFAGYTVVGVLGRGRTGEVYLVDSPRSPGREALKILPEALSADQEFRRRFMSEAQLATTLYHRNILEVHDRGEFDGRLWIAMDYVDGSTAARLIADEFPGGMPAGQALAIVAAIADALDYANHRGLVHRAVEPGRILLPGAGAGERRILLSGFGLGSEFGGLSSRAVADLTLDTVAYAAPEQLTGAGVDARADQYALAATAFTLLTGGPLFAGDNPGTVIDQQLTAARPKLSDRRPDLWPLDAVMDTALAIDPADRFGGCRKFADALGRAVSVPAGNLSPEAALVAAGGGQPATGTDQDGEFRKRRDGIAALGSRRRLWIITGSAAAASLVLALVLFAVAVGDQRDSGRRSTAGTEATSGVPAATTTSASPAPGELPRLDGTYRIDANRSRQTYNGAASPQPPDVVTWWAFRTVCSQTECVAAGVMLDDSRQAPAPDGAALSLEMLDSRWQSRPQTLRFGCVDLGGRADQQTITQTLLLRPSDPGSLRGEMTIDVVSDECGQRGAVIRVPTVAERVDEAPPGVDIPDPAAPATTTPTR